MCQHQGNLPGGLRSVSGTGDPVVLVHGGITADLAFPLLREPALTEQFRVISYHRAGYGLRPPSSEPYSLSGEATDAFEVVNAAGHPSHIIGYSLGALIGLQLALDRPEAVRSLVLIEPMLGYIPRAADAVSAIAGISQLHAAGHTERAVDRFLSMVFGECYAADFDRVCPPGWNAEALARFPYYLERELPVAARWRLEPDEARRLSAPVLMIRGTATLPLITDSVNVLAAILPVGRTAEVRGASHSLPATHAAEAAALIASFYRTLR